MSDELARFLAAHPWPREFAQERKLEWLWTVDVATPPEKMWPLLADLSRLNRALKLPRMTFTEVEGKRWGRASYSAVPHEWVEVPWNWVTNRWYEFVRIYRRGGMRALFGIYEIEPIATGSRIRIYYGIVPSAWFYHPPLRLTFSAMGRAYKRLLPRLAKEAMVDPVAPPCLRVVPHEMPADARERLEQLGAALVARGVAEPPVRKLIEWLQTATDDDLERIRVLERARAWNLDEDELLSMFLHATRVGMLELTWDVICPHCRGVRDSTGKLDKLPTEGSCEACGIVFGTDSVEAIEIAFHPHSSIRSIERGVYCSAEPAHKAHVLIQRAVPAGELGAIPMPAAPGRYRLRVRGAMRGTWVDVADDAPDAFALADPWPAEVRVAPGTTLQVQAPEERTLVVESPAWPEHALRPGKLLSFQEFRDLFSQEYLASGVQLAVGEQTILFTDLVGSTAMYERRGDPAAFVDVKQHFDQVFAIVSSHRGAVVKTIGDAVMAAFNTPLDAVRAAHAIHAAFPPGRGPDALRLRISLNTGPCIAVRLNSAIDYFGHSVNLAAKLQAAAEAWQIAMAEPTVSAPGVGELVASHGATLESLTLELKGIAEPIAVKRWTVATEAS